MAVINSSGFDPDLHVDNATPAAKVRSSNYPGMILRLSERGIAWAEELMARRPYFQQHWTIERVH